MLLKKPFVITRSRLYVNFGAGMAGTVTTGTRLERSLSLLGVSGEPPGNLEVRVGSSAAAGDSRSRSMSVNDVPSLEHSLDILINGSPIGDDAADGESLLDYNSDGNSEASVLSQPVDTLDIEMNGTSGTWTGHLLGLQNCSVLMPYTCNAEPAD
jgi:hypothetical protein